MWIVVSDELEAAVRLFVKKKGDISRLFEEAMVMFLRERGAALLKAENINVKLDALTKVLDRVKEDEG